MLPQAKVEEVETLLAEGKLSQRKISLLTGVCRSVISRIALGVRPDYASRHAEVANLPVPDGPVERCPTCGAKVYMPCRLCRLRGSVHEQDALARYRRRAKQKAARRLLAAVLRREEVQQAVATEAETNAQNVPSPESPAADPSCRANEPQIRLA